MINLTNNLALKWSGISTWYQIQAKLKVQGSNPTHLKIPR